MSLKFKVGDRVKLLENFAGGDGSEMGTKKGDLGTVAAINAESDCNFPYCVIMDGYWYNKPLPEGDVNWMTAFDCGGFPMRETEIVGEFE